MPNIQVWGPSEDPRKAFDKLLRRRALKIWNFDVNPFHICIVRHVSRRRVKTQLGRRV